jgi:hypothetical protein
MVPASIPPVVPSCSPFRVLLRRVLLSIVAILLLLYLADFAWYELRLQFPKFGPATGSVHRTRLFAIREKNNKVEYELDTVRPEEDLPCSHSLFPLGGNRPCWYVTRHANDPIVM